MHHRLGGRNCWTFPAGSRFDRTHQQSFCNLLNQLEKRKLSSHCSSISLIGMEIIVESFDFCLDSLSFVGDGGTDVPAVDGWILFDCGLRTAAFTHLLWLIWIEIEVAVDVAVAGSDANYSNFHKKFHCENCIFSKSRLLRGTANFAHNWIKPKNTYYGRHGKHREHNVRRYKRNARALHESTFHVRCLRCRCFLTVFGARCSCIFGIRANRWPLPNVSPEYNTLRTSFSQRAFATTQ